MEEKKLGFFKRIFVSITDFDIYQRFAAENIKTAIIYILKFMLLFSVLVSIASMYKLNVMFKQARDYTLTELPNFEIKDGILKFDMEENIIIENDENTPQILILDSNPENLTSNLEKLKLYKTGIGVLPDKIVINFNGFYTEETYSKLQTQLGLDTFNKDILIDKLNNTNYVFLNIFLYLLMVVVSFAAYVVWPLTDAIIMAALRISYNKNIFHKNEV